MPTQDEHLIVIGKLIGASDNHNQMALHSLQNVRTYLTVWLSSEAVNRSGGITKGPQSRVPSLPIRISAHQDSVLMNYADPSFRLALPPFQKGSVHVPKYPVKMGLGYRHARCTRFCVETCLRGAAALQAGRLMRTC